MTRSTDHIRTVAQALRGTRVRIQVGNYDLHVSSFDYLKDRRITHLDPRGKRLMAGKFL